MLELLKYDFFSECVDQYVVDRYQLWIGRYPTSLPNEWYSSAAESPMLLRRLRTLILPRIISHVRVLQPSRFYLPWEFCSFPTVKKLKEDSPDRHLLVGRYGDRYPVYLPHPGYAPNLMSYLFGNILTVTREQIILSVVSMSGYHPFFSPVSTVRYSTSLSIKNTAVLTMCMSTG